MVGCGILQIFVILGQGSVLGFLDVLLDLGLPGGVHGDLWGHEGGHGHELQVGVTDQLPGQPEKRLLKVVVGFGRDVVVLEVLLSVEHDRLGLDLPILDVDLVAGEDDGDVLTDPDQIPVPVWHVLVSHTRGHIKHDDGTLSLNVVTIPESSKLLLASSVPDVETDCSSVGMEHQGVDLDSESGHILFLELTSKMSLDKSSLSSSSITDKHKLEGGHVLSSGHYEC